MKTHSQLLKLLSFRQTAEFLHHISWRLYNISLYALQQIKKQENSNEFSPIILLHPNCILGKSCALISLLYLPYLLHGAESFLRSQLVLQLTMKFPAFYGTRKFITVLTRARYLSITYKFIILIKFDVKSKLKVGKEFHVIHINVQHFLCYLKQDLSIYHHH